MKASVGTPGFDWCFFCEMKNFWFVLFLLLISFAVSGAEKEFPVVLSENTETDTDGDRFICTGKVLSFLAKAQAGLESSLPLDEDLLTEFQELIGTFDKIAAEETEETTALFFEISGKIVDREKAAAAETAAVYRKRREADRLSGKLVCAAVGSAAAGALFFGAATVPYEEYVNAYETAAAVEARKKTVAVLIPAGILTATAGSLLISSAVVLGAGERPEKNFALLRVTEERYKGSFLRRGGF